MYEGGLHCVSFQIKKRVPIGRGGMILLDNKEDYEYIKKISYDGRDLDGAYDDDPFEYLGWHYYMTPEDAARGIILMNQVPEINEDYAGWESYPDVSKAGFLKK
jgi:dTDP-4-amino-4,6-dideoxygalactose transaminase